jgi:hypothetical protein
MQQDLVKTTKTPLHVLIIGGGIGGLCLAQGLKQAGISVAAYEAEYEIEMLRYGFEAVKMSLEQPFFGSHTSEATHQPYEGAAG